MAKIEYLYRGVHAKHPALTAAHEGRAVPSNPNGTVTPEEHNVGGFEEQSQYTSWTHLYEVARIHALRHGPGGVILRFPAGAPAPEENWVWTQSPDEYWESEILLLGERSGATVEVL